GEAGIRDGHVTGVQTCALPIYGHPRMPRRPAVEESCRRRPSGPRHSRVSVTPVHTTVALVGVTRVTYAQPGGSRRPHATATSIITTAAAPRLRGPTARPRITGGRPLPPQLRR